MKLKSVLDNLDGLDDALKAAYTEKDGKFYLNVEGIDNHPDVAGMKKSLTTVRDEKKALETELGQLKDKFGKLPDDFTVEEYNRLKDGGTGNVDQRLDDQRKRLETAHQKELDKLKATNEGLSSKLNKLHIDAALNAAISEIGVAAPFVPAVRAMHENKIKVGQEGEDVITTIDNMVVSDYLKAWATTDLGKHYIAAPGNGGGGSGGSGNQPGNKADNPWTKEGFNLTKQAEIMKSDPAKAAQLKAAAGVK